VNKEIFAALEIADHEIRLIVCEFHNFKLNVLKVERVETDGVSNTTVVNEDAVISSIQKAVNNASKMLGADIKRVILLIPSYHMGRYSKRIIVNTNTGIIEKEDIQSALKTARFVDIPSDSEIVQMVPMRYIVNGYPSKRLPIEEKSDTLGVEVEILTADKEMVYQYVSLVEKAGIRVIDICLDSYALACEAALFGQAVGKYVLLLKLERQNTTLSLLANGKLINSTVVEGGYGEMLNALSESYDLPIDICNKLLLYNLEINPERQNTTPIYYWTVAGVPHTISEKEIADKAMPYLQRMVGKLKEISKDILSSEKIICVISGEGSEIQKINEYFSREFGIDCSVYTPETLGIRNGALAPLVGSVYAYYDQRGYSNQLLYSIDHADYLQDVEEEKPQPKKTNEEDTLSNRFKRIFAKN